MRFLEGMLVVPEFNSATLYTDLECDTSSNAAVTQELTDYVALVDCEC